MSETRTIPLTRGLFATVDAADYDRLSQWRWSALKVGRKGAPPKFYASRHAWVNGKDATILMHREIIGTPKGKVTDHRDLDTLNNVRGNLRVCTQAQNSLNHAGHRDRSYSKYKGVCWHRGGQKWIAHFRKQYLGLFEKEEDAAIAYNQAALSYSPEYSVLNAVAMGG